MDSDEISLSELARSTGTERRTIRSYIAQGLMRGPNTVGRNASYGRYHLDRLRAIRVLRDEEGLGLPEIRQRFLTLSEEDIASIANRLQGTDVAAASEEREAVGLSAVAYIRSLRASIKAGQKIARTEGSSDSITEGRPSKTRLAPSLSSLRVERHEPLLDESGASPSSWHRRYHDSHTRLSVPQRVAGQAAVPDVSPYAASSEKPPAMSDAYTVTTERLAATLSEFVAQRERLDQLGFQIERLHQVTRDLREQTGELLAQKGRSDKLAIQIQELSRTIIDLQDQAGALEQRACWRDLSERLASIQLELRSMRHAYDATAISTLGPSDLATDPNTPKTEAFVRISVLPDVEVLVRGVPDEERLGLISEHAENLRKALLRGDK
jgi:DNA-binding transcriptional MerR regulator